MKKERLREKQSQKSKKEIKTAQIFADYSEDMYLNRKKIYKVNFIKGFYFGVGKTLGGLLILVIIIWLAAMMIDWPVLGRIIKDTFEYIKEIR